VRFVTDNLLSGVPRLSSSPYRSMNTILVRSEDSIPDGCPCLVSALWRSGISHWIPRQRSCSCKVLGATVSPRRSLSVFQDTVVSAKVQRFSTIT